MINALRGMRDLFPPDSENYLKIIKICEKNAKNYGYRPIKTPHLELSKLFKRSVGQSSDIVSKEMYEFQDKSENEICLRPEGTAGVLRAFLQAKLDKINGVHRYFYYGSMFRYERPQKARYREFHQFGVECFGEDSIYEDASIILMLSQILKDLNINFKLKINFLGDKNSMLDYKNSLLNFIKDKEICDDCQRRAKTNPLRMLDCKNEKCQNIYLNAPKITDSLSDDHKLEFKQLQEILKENELEFEIDYKLVRGLDYYCKTAFEFISNELGSQSAVAGGGRYDALFEEFGSKGFGLGFAIGIDRLLEILKTEKNEEYDFYICALSKDYINEIFNIGIKLRKKFKVKISNKIKKFSRHLSDSKGAKFLLCLGENEKNMGKILLKNLENRSEKMINLDEITKEFICE